MKQTKGVNTFIHQLYQILTDESAQTIQWTTETSFTVHNIEIFQQNILPQYFRHSNYSSFIRQLKLYNFKELQPNRYGHCKFMRGSPEMLKEIGRRTQSKRTEKHMQAISLQNIQEMDELYDIQIGNKRRSFELGLQRQSAEDKPFEVQLKSKIRNLHQDNIKLKKEKEQKQLAIKEMSKPQIIVNIGIKFTKLLIAFLAQKNAPVQSSACPQLNMKDIISHVLNSDQCFQFQKYKSITDSLLNNSQTHFWAQKKDPQAQAHLLLKTQ